LSEVRDSLGLNIAAFARELSIPRSTLVGWEEGKSVSIEILNTLRSQFRVNLDWFLTGEGPMFLLDNKQGECNELEPGPFAEPSDEVEVVEHRRNVLTPVRLNGRHAVEMEVTKLDPDVAFVGLVRGQLAGAGPEKDINADLEVKPLRIERKFLLPWRPDQVRALEIKGDSMTKIGLFDRDIVLFVPEEREGDGVYVISGSYGLQCKRLEFDIVDRKLRIISENDRYEPRILEGDDADRIVIEGKVIGWLHRHPY